MNCLQGEVVMLSIDNNELFEKYYQTEYDFNTTSLSLDEIDAIKKLAREKRVDYASAPMGIGIFDLIQKQSSDIRFELVSFESDKIDGMLYIPTTGKERAYIILNSNIILQAFVYYAQQNDNSNSKGLKSIYKKYCADVIKRHGLPSTLSEYIKASQDYL